MSKNFSKVERYFKTGLWNEAMVHNAVGKWITAEEYTEITGKNYEE